MFDGSDDRQGAAALGAVLDVDLEHSFTKALLGFRPSGRRSPFKTAPGGFVSSWPELMEAGAAGGAPQRGPLRGLLCEGCNGGHDAGHQPIPLSPTTMGTRTACGAASSAASTPTAAAQPMASPAVSSDTSNTGNSVPTSAANTAAAG